MPPVLTVLSVESEAKLRLVEKDMMCATTIIPNVLISPAWPRMTGNLRYMITPRMVSMEGVKTPLNVPNFLAFDPIR